MQRERSHHAARPFHHHGSSRGACCSYVGSGSTPGAYEVGQTVVSFGLTSRPELVGTLGTIMSLDVEAGRAAVQTSPTGESIRVRPVDIKLTVFGQFERRHAQTHVNLT